MIPKIEPINYWAKLEGGPCDGVVFPIHKPLPTICFSACPRKVNLAVISPPQALLPRPAVYHLIGMGPMLLYRFDPQGEIPKKSG